MSEQTKQSKRAGAKRSQTSDRNIEDILREVGRKLDHLVQETKNLEGSVRKETEKKIQTIRTHKKKIEDQLSDLQHSIRPRIEAAKPHLFEAARELRETLRALLHRPS